jgi:hypothetical protein
MPIPQLRNIDPSENTVVSRFKKLFTQTVPQSIGIQPTEQQQDARFAISGAMADEEIAAKLQDPVVKDEFAKEEALKSVAAKQSSTMMGVSAEEYDSIRMGIYNNLDDHLASKGILTPKKQAEQLATYAATAAATLASGGAAGSIPAIAKTVGHIATMAPVSAGLQRTLFPAIKRLMGGKDAGVAMAGAVASPMQKEAVSLKKAIGGEGQLSGALADIAELALTAGAAGGITKGIGKISKSPKVQSAIASAKYRIQKAMGIDVPTDVIPYDYAAAVNEGRMSLGDAARKSRTFYETEMAKRIKPETIEPKKAATYETTSAGNQQIMQGIEREMPKDALKPKVAQAEDLLSGMKPPADVQKSLFEQPMAGGMFYPISDANEAPIEMAKLSDKQWGKVNTYLKRKGYDVLGAKDVKEIYSRMTKDFTVEPTGDHLDAIKFAAEKKVIPYEEQIFKKARREYGITQNTLEAGYIYPDGAMLDLSGKRQGGPPNTRSLDHREVGGTEGMQEHMANGAVRMSDFGDNASFDIAKRPTDKQMNKIMNIARQVKGDLVIDLDYGLGEYVKQVGYYKNTGKMKSLEFEKGTSPEAIRKAINEYYSTFENMPEETRMKIFRMDADTEVRNTKGEDIVLKKGHEFRTYDIGGGKVRLQNGKQVTVWEGELSKLEGKMLGEGDQPMAGGMSVNVNVKNPEVKAQEGTANESNIRKVGITDSEVVLDKPVSGDINMVVKPVRGNEEVVPAKTPDELAKRIEQIQKFGMGQAVPTKFGGVPKTASGSFTPKERAGQIKLRHEIADVQGDFLSTLSHELGHAIHYNVAGTTKGSIMPMFSGGAIESEIMSELKDITHSLVGEEVAKNKPHYYYKPTELFARFIEKIMVEGDVAEKHPKVWQSFEKMMIEKPMIGEFIEAAAGKIDAGAPKFAFLRDKRQMYQKHLGKFVGDRAYNSQIVYRAMKERAKKAFENLIETEFQGVKDLPEQLFRSAESIKVTTGGIPEYGTRDLATATTEKEAAELLDAGYKQVAKGEVDGIEQITFAKERYSAAESKELFESLTPEGQRLIKEFTAAKEEAKTFFNRELIKEKYKVQGNIEGWVHHFFEEGRASGIGGKKLKFKLAGTRKKRTGSAGYVEDLKKATYKSLVELETEKQYNEFVDKFFSMTTKPLANDQMPQKGWVEITGDIKKGVGTAQEKMTVVVDKASGKSFIPKRPRYEMPKEIYDEFKLFKSGIEELSTTMRIVNNISRYWKINILSDPSSTGTNVLSGAIQYSTKVVGDFVKDVMAGNMDQTKLNVESMFRVVTPKGWADAPDWVYGSDKSNLYGQLLIEPGKGKVEKSIDEFGNKALYLFGLVETYFKKLIVLSESKGVDLKRLGTVTKEGLPEVTNLEKEIIARINNGVDLYGYDYENIPDQLRKWRMSPVGGLVKPFVVWPYKAMKHFTGLAGAAFDGTLPIEERISKLMALALIVSLYGAYSATKRNKQQTAPGDETTPSYFNPRGRLPLGMDKEGKEVFVKTTKYPFFGITDAGIELIKGRNDAALDVVNDALGGLGPMGEIGLLALGYGSRYAKYIPAEVTVGDKIASYIPLYRTLQNISNILDPNLRKKTKFSQSFTSLIPTTDPVMQDLLHGEKRTAKVPLEGSVKFQGTYRGSRTTTDVELTRNRNDALLYALTGILVKRIDPKQAEAFEIRRTKNLEKQAKKEAKENKKNRIVQNPLLKSNLPAKQNKQENTTPKRKYVNPLLAK